MTKGKLLLFILRIESSLPQKRGMIQMIMGGPTDGDSFRQRKLNVQKMKVEHEVAHVAATPNIQFGPEDVADIQHFHNDALVITTDITGFDVAHIFVDIGSSCDIMFFEWEVKGGQYQARRCHVDSVKIADKVIAEELGRIRVDDPELKKPRVPEDLDEVSKMQVEEEMMTVELLTLNIYYRRYDRWNVARLIGCNNKE
ncbi:hypothetical protein ACS0TY_030538 [Phlomoides rotata]